MKTEKEISRRRFLEMSSALGGIVAYGNLNSLFAQDKRILIEEQVLDPFYPIKRRPQLQPKGIYMNNRPTNLSEYEAIALTLLKVDGEWKIMNKVFHLHA